MFGKTTTRDSVNESEQLCAPTTDQNLVKTTSQLSDRNKSSNSTTSTNRTSTQQVAASTLHQHYLNYFSNKIPKEEVKSHRTRNSIFNSLSQPSQSFPNHQDGPQNINQRNNVPSNGSRNFNQQVTASSQNHAHQINQTSSSARNILSNRLSMQGDELQQVSSSTVTPNRQYPQQMHPSRQKPHSAGTLSATHSHLKDQPSYNNVTHSSRQEHHHHPHQLNRGSEELTTTMIREELPNDLAGIKDDELEALNSLERNLPIELSFLIRQQAYCMARMNYLDRQIREMRESSTNRVDSTTTPRILSTSLINQTHPNRSVSNNPNPNHHQPMQTKNGNLILSDDSGGEYSRATISDDDELSSLLDQIAKSIRPDLNNTNASILTSPPSNYNAVIGNQLAQQYTMVNPNQLHPHIHQQAVPIFVMGSPIAVAHPASSINSNILPGVHFQPEPRYNQYYEGFCYQNQMPPPPPHFPGTQSIHRNQNGRSRQFDSSISAIEQLVSQKEKWQIKNQLKFADNWIKMRSSSGGSGGGGMSNHPNGDSFKEDNNNSRSATMGTFTHGGGRSSSIPERANNIPASSSLATIVTDNNNCVAEEMTNE